MTKISKPPPRILWALVGSFIGTISAALKCHNCLYLPSLFAVIFFIIFNAPYFKSVKSKFSEVTKTCFAGMMAASVWLIVAIVFEFTVYGKLGTESTGAGYWIQMILMSYNGLGIALFFQNIREQYLFQIAKIPPMIVFNLFLNFFLTHFLFAFLPRALAREDLWNLHVIVMLLIFLSSWLPFLLWREIYGDWFSMRRWLFFTAVGILFNMYLVTSVLKQDLYSADLTFLACFIAACGSGLSIIPKQKGSPSHF